jgi:uncharacterized protein (DUF2235 family)
MTDANTAPHAERRIVLLSDGTGNSASKVWRTNVWRVFESLDLRDSTQVAIYDDGVGTSSFKPLALLGGGFGWGLKRNVLDLYCFLCRNYRPNTDVYVFGFSRGAFTVRVLLGLVAHQGLVPCNSESELQRLARDAYRAYRKERYHSLLHVEWAFRALRDIAIAGWNKLRGITPYDVSANVKAVPIRFVGVWDTVAAYGLPIEEMTRGISQWVWPLELPNRQLGADVKRACHAIALDDERTTFQPVLWSERNEAPATPDAEGKRWTRDERVSQVWFVGMHSNVGGGYPDDSLAHVPLCWMISEAMQCGLRFKETPFADPDAVRHALSAADKDGRLYDSRKGLGGYYRYGPRKIFDLCHVVLSGRPGDEVTIDAPKIHETAFLRTINGAHAYAPIGLPASYEVVRPLPLLNGGIDHEILDAANATFETPTAAKVRAMMQEQIWDLVWWRRVVYFLTLGASLHLALVPVLYESKRAHEFESQWSFVSGAVRTLSGFLPGFTTWWMDAFAANPATFATGVIALVALMLLGVALGSKIADRMRSLWMQAFDRRLPATAAEPSGPIYRIRTNALYTSAHWIFKRHIVPFLSAVVVLYLAFALVNKALFTVQDSFGSFCREGTRPLVENIGARNPTHVAEHFDPRDPCWSTGFKVEEGGRYRVTVVESRDNPWRDKNFDSQARGFEISELPDFDSRVVMTLLIPLRRDLAKPWFRPIARIGAVGSDEYPLDPDTEPSLNRPGSDRVVADFKARRSGELFLYVNEAALGIPGLYRYFYDNNKGSGTVCIERLGRSTANLAVMCAGAPPVQRARKAGSK